MILSVIRVGSLFRNQEFGFCDLSLTGFQKKALRTRSRHSGESRNPVFSRILDSRFRGSDGELGFFRILLIDIDKRFQTVGDDLGQVFHYFQPHFGVLVD